MSSRTAVPEVPRGELTAQPELDRSRIRRRLIGLGLLVLILVALIGLVPGLASVRSRFAGARPEWLVLGGALKLLSGVSYVAAFRGVFCARMGWGLSAEIGLAELGANAVVPTGGAGGLALGAWALRRAGMETERIANRSVAFFFLTSIPNVLGVLIIGLGLALGVFAGRAGPALTLLPALIAAGAIVLTVAGGRWAEAASRRLARRRGPNGRIAKALGVLASGVREALALLREHDPWLIAGLAGYLAFDVMILWCTFHAFGAAPELAIIWIAYLIGELGGLLPVPGGVGGVDLGLVGALALYNVPAAAATAAVLAYRAIALLVPAALGSVAFVLLRRSLERETRALDGCSPGGEVELIGRGAVRLSD